MTNIESHPQNEGFSAPEKCAYPWEAGPKPTKLTRDSLLYNTAEVVEKILASQRGN